MEGKKKYYVLIITSIFIFIIFFVNQHFFFHLKFDEIGNDFIIELNPKQYFFNKNIKQFFLIQEEKTNGNLYEILIEFNNTNTIQSFRIINDFNLTNFKLIIVRNNIKYKIQSLYKYKQQKVYLSDKNWEYY